MFIEKVHGLQATNLSLNDRFTMLGTELSERPSKNRRNFPGPVNNQNLGYMNPNMIDQIARRMQLQSKRQAVRQRLGIPYGGLRRYGSENNLPGLRRANSFGNLNGSIKNRVAWRNSNNNLSRSASLSNLRGSTWRNMKRRGGQRPFRGRFRNTNNYGMGRARAFGHPLQRISNGFAARGNVRGRARGRGQGRGGMQRKQFQKKDVPTKDELDQQLDHYMASTKAALDRDLDVYMEHALEMD